MAEMNLKRILVFTACPGIGDMIARLPAIEALKHAFPSAHMAIVIRDKPVLHEITKDLPYIDEIIIQNRPYKKLALWQMWRFGWMLRKRQFDAVLIFGRSKFREPFLAYFSGAKIRIGYETKKGIGRSLLTHVITAHPDDHEIENIFKVIAPLGIQKPKNIQIHFPVQKAADSQMESFLKNHHLKPRRFVVLLTCANYSGRRWPKKRFSEIIDYLQQEFGLQSILVGSQQDRLYITQIIEGAHSNAINLAGQTTLSQLAALLKKCALFIGVDSGPMHLAAALDVPIIALFGPSHFKRWAPWQNHADIRHQIITKNLDCSPCSEKCIHATHICMEQIELKDVTTRIDAYLGK